jgi:hypothetical protein
LRWRERASLFVGSFKLRAQRHRLVLYARQTTALHRELPEDHGVLRLTNKETRELREHLDLALCEQGGRP